MIRNSFNDYGDAKLIKKLDELNPYILKFLKCVQTIQVSHLRQKFKEELMDYLRFLLRFANIDEDFKKT